MMYTKTEGQLILPGDFFLPFNKTNRWITLASLVPWERIETMYAKSFSENQYFQYLILLASIGSNH